MDKLNLNWVISLDINEWKMERIIVIRNQIIHDFVKNLVICSICNNEHAISR
jgi:hypothetical protein